LSIAEDRHPAVHRTAGQGFAAVLDRRL